MERHNFLLGPLTCEQYAYVRVNEKGIWHAYGRSARLLQLMLRDTLSEQELTPDLDVLEVDFYVLMELEIALCYDTVLVIKCMPEKLNRAS